MTLVLVGTGTDVGKTVVAATLLARYGLEIPLAYWKPVATGARDGRDTATVEALAGDRAAILAESYLFDEPLSPHLAARLAGQRIEPAVLLADFERHRAGARTLVIETAGGLLVPLVDDRDGDGGNAPGGAGGPRGGPGAGGRTGVTEASGDGRGWPFRLPSAAASQSPSASPLTSPSLSARRSSGGAAAGAVTAASDAPAASGAPGAAYLQADMVVDMARRASLSCLVVTHTGLGTINHTLLTLEALRARGLAVAGVVLDGPPNRENRRAIERFGDVEAIFELPHLVPLDREEVAAATRHFDRHGHLAPLLRLRRHVPARGDRPGEGPRGSGPSRRRGPLA